MLHPLSHLKNDSPVRRQSLSSFDRPNRNARAQSVSSTDLSAVAALAAAAAATTSNAEIASLPLSFLQTYQQHLNQMDEWCGPSLFFVDAEIEVDYRSAQLKALIPKIWGMSVFGMIISVLFAASDLYHMDWNVLPIRFATLLLAVMSVFLTSPKRSQEFGHPHLLGSFFIIGAFVVLSVARLRDGENLPESNSIVFAIVFLCLFRITLVDSLARLIPAILILFGTAFIYMTPLYACMATVPTIVIFILFVPSVYFSEKLERQGFYLDRLMDSHHTKLIDEKQKTEKLLTNIYPKHIADKMQLKIQNTFESPDETEDEYGQEINFNDFAAYYPCCSVLFADVVGFTTLSSDMNPSELVSILNQMFSAFDYLALRFKLEKIKTIGDAYMVAGGIPTTHQKTHSYVVHMGFNMIHTINQLKSNNPVFKDFSIRIGIATGPAHSGIVGRAKRTFELFGEAVKMAHIMESTGIPMMVHASKLTYELTKEKFNYLQKDAVPEPGMPMTYLLVDKKDTDPTKHSESQPQLLSRAPNTGDNQEMQILVVPKIDRNVSSFRGPVETVAINNMKRKSKDRITSNLMIDIIYHFLSKPWKMYFEDEHLEIEYWNDFWNDSRTEKMMIYHTAALTGFLVCHLVIQSSLVGFMWEICSYQVVMLLIIFALLLCTKFEWVHENNHREWAIITVYIFLYVVSLARNVFIARSEIINEIWDNPFTRHYFLMDFSAITTFLYTSPRYTVCFWVVWAALSMHIFLLACGFPSLLHDQTALFSEVLYNYIPPAIVSVSASWFYESTARKVYVGKKLNKRIAEELSENQSRAEALILSILPEAIYFKLKTTGKVDPEYFSDVSIMFIDIYNFHGLTDALKTTQKIEILNEMFSMLDKMVSGYRLEKIKTISDAYMVVGGLSNEVSNHLECIALMALDVQKILLKKKFPRIDEPITVKIGIHVGPIVGGVVGITKYIYDVWGDAVNIASRMESSGVGGEIQVSKDVYSRLTPRFLMEPRGEVLIKGKGEMETFLLRGVRLEIPGSLPSPTPSATPPPLLDPL